MRIFTNKFSVCALALALAGCSDGWTPERTDTLFPYGNQRTAGSGVVYVRSQMEPMPVADHIFTDSLIKVKPQAGTEKAVTPEEAAVYINAPEEPVPPSASEAAPAAEGAESKPPLSWREGAAREEDRLIQEEANKRALAALRSDLAATSSSESVFMSEKEIKTPKLDLLYAAEETGKRSGRVAHSYND